MKKLLADAANRGMRYRDELAGRKVVPEQAALDALDQFDEAMPGQGEPENFQPSAADKDRGKKAVKCDACVSINGGPACVRACPTGAAVRLSPDQFATLVSRAMAKWAVLTSTNA